MNRDDYVKHLERRLAELEDDPSADPRIIHALNKALDAYENTPTERRLEKR